MMWEKVYQSEMCWEFSEPQLDVAALADRDAAHQAERDGGCGDQCRRDEQPLATRQPVVPAAVNGLAPLTRACDVFRSQAMRGLPRVMRAAGAGRD